MRTMRPQLGLSTGLRFHFCTTSCIAELPAALLNLPYIPIVRVLFHAVRTHGSRYCIGGAIIARLISDSFHYGVQEHTFKSMESALWMQDGPVHIWNWWGNYVYY